MMTNEETAKLSTRMLSLVAILDSLETAAIKAGARSTPESANMVYGLLYEAQRIAAEVRKELTDAVGF